MSRLGDRIRVLRLKRGITQVQLADALNLKRSAIGNYERGIREPDLDTIEAMADYFDVSMGDILGRDEYDAINDKISEIKKALTPLSESKEWQILSSGWAQMSKSEQQRVVDVVKAMYPDRFHDGE